MLWYNVSMPKRINVEQYKKEIISRYESGESHVSIASGMPFSSGTVINRLREWDVEMRTPGFVRLDLVPHKEKIIAMYTSGMSVHKIADLTPFNHDTIHNRLKEWDVKLRRPAHLAKYSVRHDAFSGALGEYGEYFLGFLAADGCVSKQKGQFSTILVSKDMDILEKFREFVNPDKDKPIYDNKDGTFTFQITSEQIGNDLIRYGITPRKSLSIEISDYTLLSSRHFWRGYVDGDGSLSADPTYVGLFSGCKNIIDSFLDFLETNNIDRNSVYLIQNKYYSCRYAGKRSLPVIELLYKNADVYLNRKYEIAKVVMPNESRLYSSRRLELT